MSRRSWLRTPCPEVEARPTAAGLQFPPDAPYARRHEITVARPGAWYHSVPKTLDPMSKKSRTINLPPPYLRRIWLDETRVSDTGAYPFCLPLFARGFELGFDRAITIIVGENGTGKSTLLEGIAKLAGYDDAGGGKGYMPVDHSTSIEATGDRLADALRASWLPKITTGWFFKAESFFSVARYLDRAARDVGERGPDFLSYSHGEGF